VHTISLRVRQTLSGERDAEKEALTLIALFPTTVGAKLSDQHRHNPVLGITSQAGPLAVGP
jgi:hypothetical protein